MRIHSALNVSVLLPGILDETAELLRPVQDRRLDYFKWLQGFWLFSSPRSRSFAPG